MRRVDRPVKLLGDIVLPARSKPENLLRKTHKAPSLEIDTLEALPGTKPGGVLGLHKH